MWWPFFQPDATQDLQQAFRDVPCLFRERCLSLQKLRGAVLFLARPEEVSDQTGEYCLLENLRRNGAPALILRNGVPDYSLPGATFFAQRPNLIEIMSHERDRMRSFQNVLICAATLSNERGVRLLIARPRHTSAVKSTAAAPVFFGSLVWVAGFLLLWAKSAVQTRTVRLSLSHQLPLFFVLVFLPSLWLSELVIQRSGSESSFNLEETGKRTLRNAFLAMDDSYHLIIQWAVALFSSVADNEEFITSLQNLERGANQESRQAVSLAPFQNVAAHGPREPGPAGENDPFLRRLAEHWYSCGFATQYLLAHLPQRSPLGYAIQTSELSGLKSVSTLFHRFGQDHLQRANRQLETTELDPKKEMLMRAELDEIINVLRNLTPSEQSTELFLAPRAFSEILFFKGQTNIFNMAITVQRLTRYYLQATAVYTQFLRHLLENFRHYRSPEQQIHMPLSGSTFERRMRQYRHPFMLMVKNAGEMDYERFENRQPLQLSQSTLMAQYLQEMVWGRSSGKSGDWLYATQASQNVAQFIFTGLYPLDEMLRQLVRSIEYRRIMLFAVLAAALLLAILIARRFLEPLHRLRHACKEVTCERFQTRLAEDRADEFGELGRAFNVMLADVASGKLLGTFVPESLRDAVRTMDDNLSGRPAESREVTVLFTTLAGWKTRLAHAEAEDLINSLNSYHELTTRLIRRHGGIIDKILGEKILAFFAVSPGQGRDVAAAKAVRCARELLSFWRHHAPGVEFPPAIGMVSGTALAGVLGTPEIRLDYTIIGDTVNLASRLCDLACSLPNAGLVLEPVTIAAPFFRQRRG